MSLVASAGIPICVKCWLVVNIAIAHHIFQAVRATVICIFIVAMCKIVRTRQGGCDWERSRASYIQIICKYLAENYKIGIFSVNNQNGLTRAAIYYWRIQSHLMPLRHHFVLFHWARFRVSLVNVAAHYFPFFCQFLIAEWES